MAIEQQRRENLLLEATAYTRRALFRLPQAGLGDRNELSQRNEWLRQWLLPFRQSEQWELLVGMRSDGGWSIYFDEQPVLQFNSNHQLRRLFASNQRYSADQGHLQLLDRPSRGGQVTLGEVKLDSASHQSLLAACQWFLQAAGDALGSASSHRVGLIPAGDDSWLALLQERVQQAALGVEVALTPRA